MTGDGEAVGAPLVEGYRDLAVIGRGGFATVYRARQERFDRVVALKVLDRFDPSAEDRERFERECRAVGSLSRHPNIVVVHDSGVTADGRLYLAMEHLEGGSLAARVHHDGPLPWPDVARVGVEVAGALDTAHAAGILHRDLKPDNVLLGAFGEAKLGDFGIAAVEGGPATATGQGALTVLYAAPEVLRCERATARSEVFSLASTLYTLLAGRAAFARGTDESVAVVVLRAVSEPAPDLRPTGVPDDLAAVLEAAMAPDPARRTESAAELGRGLQEVQRAHGLAVTELRLDRRPEAPGPPGRGDGSPTVRRGPPAVPPASPGPPDPSPADPPPAGATPEPRGRHRGRRIALAAVVVALAGAGLAGWLLTRDDGDGAAVPADEVVLEEAGEAGVDPFAADPTSTSTSTTAATTTTETPAVPAATTPEAAAEGLLAAWVDEDFDRALVFAEPDVIGQLRDQPEDPSILRLVDEGCRGPLEDAAPGSFSCVTNDVGFSAPIDPATLIVSLRVETQDDDTFRVAFVQAILR
ncbi:MAG: serine/threonine protein kinase [Acidimicrobiales bacterium]|nr:serine/threonine protein kinase [Acidimicrobiales bacterium]